MYLAENQTEALDGIVVNETAQFLAPNASQWTNICIVRSTYMRGMMQQRAQKSANAMQTFNSITPWLEKNRGLTGSNPQLSYWTEQLLAEVALAHSRDSQQPGADAATSTSFRAWALLASKRNTNTSMSYGHPGSRPTKVSVWRAYYDHVSRLVQASSEAEPDARRELVTELRRVETAYENELLRNTQFPKASESNQVIERWVEQVTTNWDVICGSGWSEEDLGDGGRDLVTRNVLDILYRAAMKTFHSTLILRKLFQAHKAVAEFDLAYKALDSYLELIERSRTRSKKTNESHGQDPDRIVLLTLSEAILGLCSFGRQPQAEKADRLSRKLEEIFYEIDPTAAAIAGPQIEVNGVQEHAQSVVELSPLTIETVHRALGVAKAHWARWTPFNEERTRLQSTAVLHLKAAVGQPLSPTDRHRSLFALALLLAQTRDIDGAVEYVKEALADQETGDSSGYIMQRGNLPLWHLLSLLLTARQEYDVSEQACVAAFEQFPSPEVLFGSRHGVEDEKGTTSKGLVEDMECSELERILELRITELALTDLKEGPEEAVNNSNDLLALYSRLFGRHGPAVEESPPKKTPVPPSTANGTVKSFRGSLFRRSRIASSETATTRTNGVASSINTDTTRPATRATQAPTIQVTDEDEKPSPHKHRLFRHSHERSRKGRHSTESNTSNLSSRPRARSNERNVAPVPSTIASSEQSFETIDEPATTSDPPRPQLETIYSAEAIPKQPPITTEHNADPSAKQPLPEMSHNLAHHDDVPPPAHHSDQPPEQDTRLPIIHPRSSSTAPIPRFPRAASQKHALTILIKLWLLIARLYRRATMFEDSREATDEAAKAVLKIEVLISTTVESSARAFADPGWGSGGKSSDECWADVYCERGELLLAIADARAAAASDTANPASGGTKPSMTAKPHHDRDQTVREAVDMLEQCLMYKQTHLRGGIVLSNVLLDYYERKVELAHRSDDDAATLRNLGAPIPAPSRPDHEPEQRSNHHQQQRAIKRAETSLSSAIHGVPEPVSTPAGLADEDLKKTPENLNRLAARDRAYGLLSGLTKGGEGWDDSEAWFALARAHELGGEVERAKEILWWVVKLEEGRPLRGWGCVNAGGYVL